MTRALPTSRVAGTPPRRFAVVVVFREPSFDANGTLEDRPRIAIVETLAATGSDAARHALRAFRSMSVESTDSICLEGEYR
jgi:hypothetical protein